MDLRERAFYNLDLKHKNLLVLRRIDYSTHQTWGQTLFLEDLSLLMVKGHYDNMRHNWFEIDCKPDHMCPVHLY